MQRNSGKLSFNFLVAPTCVCGARVVCIHWDGHRHPPDALAGEVHLCHGGQVPGSGVCKGSLPQGWQRAAQHACQTVPTHRAQAGLRAEEIVSCWPALWAPECTLLSTFTGLDPWQDCRASFVSSLTTITSDGVRERPQPACWATQGDCC